MSSCVSLVPTSPSLLLYYYHQCFVFLMLMSSLYLWVPHGDNVYNRDGTQAHRHTRVKNVSVLILIARIFEISFKNPSALLDCWHYRMCCWCVCPILHLSVTVAAGHGIYYILIGLNWRAPLSQSHSRVECRLIPISLHSQDRAVASHGLYVM